jgi:hypothetical protein
MQHAPLSVQLPPQQFCGHAPHALPVWMHAPATHVLLPLQTGVQPEHVLGQVKLRDAPQLSTPESVPHGGAPCVAQYWSSVSGMHTTSGPASAAASLPESTPVSAPVSAPASGPPSALASGSVSARASAALSGAGAPSGFDAASASPTVASGPSSTPSSAGECPSPAPVSAPRVPSLPESSPLPAENEDPHPGATATSDAAQTNADHTRKRERMPLALW